MKQKIKLIINRLIKTTGFQFIAINKVEYEKLIDEDKIFSEIYDTCKPYTMTSKYRCYALYNAVRYAVKNNIAGDYVECGVWKGGSSMLIAKTLLSLGVTDKKLYLMDTFEGMSEPTEYDEYLPEKIDTKKTWQQASNRDGHNEWCYSSLDEVKNNMEKTEYPSKNIICIKGKVENTLTEKNSINDIAILRLDTDWYESTKVEMEKLYPLLQQNGVLILDDYGAWAGAKKAVDEYFDANDINLLINRIDEGGRLMLKV